MSSNSRSHSHSRSPNPSRDSCAHRAAAGVAHLTSSKSPSNLASNRVQPSLDRHARSNSRHTSPDRRPGTQRSRSAPSPQSRTVPPPPSTHPPPLAIAPSTGAVNLPSRANMMAFNPYMGMMGGAPGAGSYSNMGMGGPFDPRMSMIGQYPMMSGMGGPMPHAGGTPGVGPGSGAMNSDGSLKPFDSSQMKRGRMGHYGYLEGRELAGPPPGHLPAGMSPMYDQGLSTQGPTSQIMGSPTDTGSGTAPSSAGYYPQTAAGGATGRTGPKTSWGDPNVGPRARYDGTSATQQIVQADVDSPYPLTARGGVASAFTKYEGYGPERAAASGIDGRLGWAHRRTREGKV
ncbi:hypothetical protein BD324DRAFT_647733 [Kockovaella imperatae]|uniref:Uncharacterized protein n=1 Tax=Kockovaella imperatae TaxID=4999 RepID=A0A1Y1UT80_9TREE|nr:hypothetical protein BD324DRAFT_647733 [Kockovaella imperatae]ORX40827.1 hypothetical protein BD324DRAFT_647733 [Kockovaella imperatae]